MHTVSYYWAPRKRKLLCVFTGFVQFVESVAVAEILAAESSILTYFRKLAPSDNTATGIAPEVMDNYIKSCGVWTFVNVYYVVCIQVILELNGHVTLDTERVLDLQCTGCRFNSSSSSSSCVLPLPNGHCHFHKWPPCLSILFSMIGSRQTKVEWSNWFSVRQILLLKGLRQVSHTTTCHQASTFFTNEMMAMILASKNLHKGNKPVLLGIE